MESNPEPIANTLPAVWPLVIEDMNARHQLGVKRYGTPLQPFNGRKPLVDAYEEVLDLAVYLRQEIEEQKRGGEVLRTRNEISELHKQLKANIEETSAMSIKFRDEDNVKTGGQLSGLCDMPADKDPRTQGHGAQRACEGIRAQDNYAESPYAKCIRLEKEVLELHKRAQVYADKYGRAHETNCELRNELAKAMASFKCEQDMRVQLEKDHRDRYERATMRFKEKHDEIDKLTAQISALEQTLSFYLKPEA